MYYEITEEYSVDGCKLVEELFCFQVLINSMSLLRYSLNQDELVSPQEKRLKEMFFVQSNVNRIVEESNSRVDPAISHACVVDTMHCVFTNMLGHNQILSISQLNTSVVQELFRRKVSSDKASAVSRSVGFERSKIPSRMLPRPSFSMEDDDKDVHGDIGYTFFR